MGSPPRWAGVFLAVVYVRGHELCKRRYTGRFARYARVQKLCAGQANGPQVFIASEKIHNLDAVCLSGITRLQRSQERLDGDVDEKIIEFLTGW